MGQYNQIATSETHLRRYYRNKAGESVTEIAAQDHVDELTVKNSIRSVELYRARRNSETVNEATAGVVLDVLPKAKRSLSKQLEAKTVVVENGKKRKEDDFATQRSAISELRGLIQTIQPKAPTVHATHTQVGVNVGGAPRLASGSYVGMEDRLKTITQELSSASVEPSRKALTQAPLVPIEDGEYEEAEPVEELSE